MSITQLPTPDTPDALLNTEARARAQWLHDHDAPKNWLVVTREEMSALKLEFEQVKRQRDEARRELEEAKSQIANLESQRENWRVSSVCRELRAELEASQAQVLDLRAALDALPHNPNCNTQKSYFSEAKRAEQNAVDLKNALRNCALSLDALATFHRHSETWTMMDTTAVLESAKAALRAHNARVNLQGKEEG